MHAKLQQSLLLLHCPPSGTHAGAASALPLLELELELELELLELLLPPLLLLELPLLLPSPQCGVPARPELKLSKTCVRAVACCPAAPAAETP